MISVIITTDDEMFGGAGDHSEISHLRIHDELTGVDGHANYVWTLEIPGRDGMRGHYRGFPVEKGALELTQRVLADAIKELHG